MMNPSSLLFKAVAANLLWVCKTVAGGEDESVFQFHLDETSGTPIRANFQSQSGDNNTNEQRSQEGEILRLSFQVLGIAAFIIVVIITILNGVKYFLCRNSRSTQPEMGTQDHVYGTSNKAGRTIYDPESIPHPSYSNCPTISTRSGASTPFNPKRY